MGLPDGSEKSGPGALPLTVIKDLREDTGQGVELREWIEITSGLPEVLALEKLSCRITHSSTNETS